MNATAQNASDMIFSQHATIMEAIRLLEKAAEEMTDRINPSEATWRNVGEYAHVADAASVVLERLAQ